MDRKLLAIGALVLLAVVVISGCAQPPSVGDIKSAGDAQKAVKNITSDIQDVGNTLNELENIFE